MALGLYDYPTGPRRYLACCWPHTLLSSGRLHSERLSFNNLQHMLLYWAHRLFELAFAASLDAIDPNVPDKQRREAWADVAREAEMVLMLAEGAEVSRPVADMMIHRSLDAGREAAIYWEEHCLNTDECLPYERFYPWFEPGYWGTGDYDAERAADLAELERIVADRLGIPEYQRKITIELGPGERWY
jgi:hypothetical protein